MTYENKGYGNDPRRMRADMLSGFAPATVVDDLTLLTSADRVLHIYGIVYALLDDVSVEPEERIRRAQNEIRQAAIKLDEAWGQ